MKFAIGAALAAFTIAGSAAADMPDALGYIVCHGERTGEVFVLNGKPGGITEVPSHPGVEVIEQDDGLTLVDPAGPVYKLGLGDSFMLRDGQSYPMSCEDKTEIVAAGAETMARRQLAELRGELSEAEGEVRRLEAVIETMRAERAEIEEIRVHSAFLAERLPSRSMLAKWLEAEATN